MIILINFFIWLLQPLLFFIWMWSNHLIYFYPILSIKTIYIVKSFDFFKCYTPVL
ncbi:hypothetical protein GLOIN_2v1722956 [Rhizophagus irregularis DAOM 181602=DAOM 197198]|uniref:Uncharacterized protein n=1 Tax=Rhizophagus irregularis (strain DAOM 181602 / DAOM 197198 / MUCL 43194) TaxID=747089 RepID=A0A2P4P1T8_RHIID|nr:hypothetical protein GLOIN_2v1722956 [Rhizophagus irregularis DAOM 181602=DAOM 197198]POG59328.1 hypothetical protein GLOIN_2v1722956 [Rhizophagus irregularis DAOM 181602=DAOM 197198]GET51918.1 hypothetical protein GLOIN_2v1722956 [Rhizophagus irregularis DAOM 181602=DAOM 197198]|eukprot:XP_025166194.1 hypothetical protein GLOIN_2v1722956 [Rhizophagus irregularis DAOM 181602=DAOM 197198]